MLSAMPKGFKIAHHVRSDVGMVLEMIPESESLDRWTEMLTIQVIRNLKGYTPTGFYSGMKKAWAEMCPCGSTEIVERGREQLQPTLFWRHGCPLNKDTGEPEYTWFKVLIRGGNVVITQKAFKYEPSAEAVEHWLGFLRALRVNHRLENQH
jgi:hypothetical protein